MRNTVIWSFLSLVALATGGLVTGCDSDEKLSKSGLGDSCTKTSDCDDSLRCIEGACYPAATSTGGSANGEGGDGAGPIIGPKPEVLGGEGESCSRAADCEAGLGCFSGRCQAAVNGEGGANGGPTLGGTGETCTLTTDCAKDHLCLPGRSETSFGVGVCTPVNSGLTPTGKICQAECVEAADCCELPVAQHAALGVYSCADLAEKLAGVNCAAALSTTGAMCLAYASYCDDQCGANTWACDAGQCSYTAKCTKATEVEGGCPAYTRGGHPVPTCDTKAGKCTGAPIAVVGCKTDKQCDGGLAVADSATGDLCSAGECTCYTDNGGCYRKCSESEDCAAGFTCSEETTLCVPLGTCTTDAQCINSFRDIRYTCVDSICQPPACENDIDCNPFGLTDGNFASVCGPDKQCVALGCSTNDECGAYAASGNAGGVRSFCSDPVTTPTAVAPVSAITD